MRDQTKRGGGGRGTMRGTHTSTNEEDTTHSVTRISSSMYLTTHTLYHNAHKQDCEFSKHKTASMAIFTLVHHAPSLASFPVFHVILGTGLLAPSCVSVKTVSQVPCGQKGTQNWVVPTPQCPPRLVSSTQLSHLVSQECTRCSQWCTCSL